MEISCYGYSNIRSIGLLSTVCNWEACNYICSYGILITQFMHTLHFQVPKYKFHTFGDHHRSSDVALTRMAIIASNATVIATVSTLFCNHGNHECVVTAASNIKTIGLLSTVCSHATVMGIDYAIHAHTAFQSSSFVASAR